LFGEFTVRETLQYFGRIYGMPSEEVKAQTKFLIQLLDLPDSKHRLIRSFR
jgi:ABC-type multidrug transport system ATPase subunit